MKIGGGGLKVFARKEVGRWGGGVTQNWGDLPRNEGKLLYYNEVFVDIPHNAE